MPKGLFVLIILLVLVIGGAFFLSSRVTEQPTKTVEVNVTGNAASN